MQEVTRPKENSRILETRCFGVAVAVGLTYLILLKIRQVIQVMTFADNSQIPAELLTQRRQKIFDFSQSIVGHPQMIDRPSHDPVSNSRCVIAPDELLVEKPLLAISGKSANLFPVVGSFIASEQGAITEFGKAGFVAAFELLSRYKHP